MLIIFLGELPLIELQFINAALSHILRSQPGFPLKNFLVNAVDKSKKKCAFEMTNKWQMKIDIFLTVSAVKTCEQEPAFSLVSLNRFLRKC